MFKKLFEGLKKLSAAGSQLMILTDGEGGIFVQVLSSRPLLDYQEIIDENGNEVEAFAQIQDGMDEEDKTELINRTVEECIKKKKADMVRKKIEKMTDEEFIKLVILEG